MSDTKAKTFADLLREISELAPEVVRIFKGEISGVDMIHVDGYGLLKRLDDVVRRKDYAIIQAALQEACKGRRWTYQVTQYGDINDDRDDCVVTIWPEGTWMHQSDWEGSAKKPTNAFTKAFLKALRA